MAQLSFIVLYADSSAQGLFDAVRLGNMSNVKAAVNGGVDVSSVDAYGNTLLMQVALCGKAAEFVLAMEPRPQLRIKADIRR